MVTRHMFRDRTRCVQKIFQEELEERRKMKKIEEGIFEEIRKSYTPNQPITSSLTVITEWEKK